MGSDERVLSSAGYWGLCFRCGKTRTPYGIECVGCRPAGDAEYARLRAANGGRPLYLPAPAAARRHPEGLEQVERKGRRPRYKQKRPPRKRTPNPAEWWADDPVGCGMSAYGIGRAFSVVLEPFAAD